MSDVTTSLAAETELVREAYAALNRGDVPGFVSLFDEQIERVEFAELPEGATYHGLTDVTAHVMKGRGTWAEGSCQPQRFVVAGDRVIVFVHVHVRLKTETTWREGDVVDVFTFRNGKATQFRSFINEQAATNWIEKLGRPFTESTT